MGSLIQASQARNGRHSFMTERQSEFVSWLIQHATVVPVTARSTEAFAAVSIPFQNGAILSNGAVILDSEGRPDPEWLTHMRLELEQHQARLPIYLETARAIAVEEHVEIRSWIVEEDGLRTYVVVKEEGDGNGRGLEIISDRMKHKIGKYTVHRNGNNLSFSPPCLSKRNAAAFFIQKARSLAPSTPVIGMGDSISDFSFLSLCDWWAAPMQSQITGAMGSLTSWFSELPPNFQTLMDEAESHSI